MGALWAETMSTRLCVAHYGTDTICISPACAISQVCWLGPTAVGLQLPSAACSTAFACVANQNNGRSCHCGHPIWRWWPAKEAAQQPPDIITLMCHWPNGSTTTNANKALQVHVL